MKALVRGLITSGTLLALSALALSMEGQQNSAPLAPATAPAMARKREPDPPAPRKPRPRRDGFQDLTVAVTSGEGAALG
jgi:hypothetical protein